MILNIKNINGNILLYRDAAHKKKVMCKYLAQNIITDKTICIYSTGAFGLYIAKAFPNNNIVICRPYTTEEYQQQINKLPNVTINSNVRSKTEAQKYAEENDYLYINQFSEPLILNYYKHHLLDILNELKDIEIDAFCDCGHSCATIAGFIEANLTNWQFILGVNGFAERNNIHHLMPYKNQIIQESTKNFDTQQIQIDIEAMYPDFGNIFEATRSISAAMSWLQKNPGKTVLVYVGDSPVFGEDAEI